MLKSWKTTLLGGAAIIIGLWAMHVTRVPSQTWQFNVIYVWTGPLALIVAGIGLVHSKDHDK